MKNVLIVFSFLCATAFAADHADVDKKALQKPDKPAKIDGCCKICKSDKSKPCGNVCISLNKECAKNHGCACTPDGKHELEEKPIWVAPK